MAGALFVSAPDPVAAVRAVEARLRGETARHGESALEGVPEEIIDEYADLLPHDAEELRFVLTCGAAWALGVRAAPQDVSRWRPVVSGTGLGPPDFRHRTGETLVQLIMSARKRLRFAPAYIDVAAAQYLGPSLAAATERGVFVSVLVVDQLEKGPAVEDLATIIHELGSKLRFDVRRGTASDGSHI